MSTRSFIGKVTENREVVAVYCHYDGYPDGVGKTLQEHYQDEQKIDELLSLGDMSYLTESIECPEGHSFENPVDGYTVFYGRDRGEKDVSAKTYFSKAQFRRAARRSWIDYIYLYKDSHWEVSKLL